MPRSFPSFPDNIGRYEIVRLLGQGAMGRVFLAHDPVLDRHVAVKLLRDDLGLPPEHQRQLFERMRQEARASARISHPNIVALFDMGEDATYGLFLVFEYVHGPTLKDRLATERLPVSAVARLASELGEALSTAHAAGVLHRDIKPENVILSPTGAKIADFGIARVPESTLTRDGRLLGTPAYSSPESIAHGVFSAASDQFSLATTLYEALSLARAFPGDDAVRVATLITTTKPEPIADRCGLDGLVDTVLERAMHQDPAARFSSCADFGHALASALGQGTAPLALVNSSNLRRDQDSTSRPLRIVLGAGTLGALLMAAALQMTRGCNGRPPELLRPQDELATADARPVPSTIPRRHTRAPSASSRQSVATLATAQDAGAGPSPSRRLPPDPHEPP